MKPRTFTQRWNPTALKRIKKAYETTVHLQYLCEVPEFKQLWEAHRINIRDLAIAFDESAMIPIVRSGNVLFYKKDRRPTRISFLNHEITRLTTLRKANLG